MSACIRVHVHDSNHFIGLPSESESEAEKDSDDVMPAVLEENESERF